jgi:type I restriction enzyme, S subunit
VKAGWKVKPLEDAAHIVNGGTPKTGVAEYWGGEVQWLTPKDMGQMQGREIANTPRAITEKGLRDSSARLVPPHSVILSTRAPIGHLAINTAPMAFNQGCRGIVPLDGLDHLFLYYFLLANRELLDSLGTGTTFKELSGGSLKAVPISLPPIEEQHQIVAVLDEAFEGLARARAHAETNLRDARELFARLLDNEFANARPGWANSDLGSICTKIGSGATPRGGEAAYKAEGISLIRSLNIHDREFRFKNLAFLDDQQAEKLDGVTIASGDVLLNITGASVARCAIVPSEVLPARVNQHVSIIRPKAAQLDNEFLCYLLTAPAMKARLLQTGSEGGSTRQAITKADIQELVVHLPKSLDEQRAIVDNLKAAENETLALVSHYFAKVKDIDALRQSLLQKAFAGELT